MYKLDFFMFLKSLSSILFQYFVNFKLGEEYLGGKYYYAASFMLYLTIVSQLPNLLFNWLNIFCPIG